MYFHLITNLTYYVPIQTMKCRPKKKKQFKKTGDILITFETVLRGFTH